MNISKLLKFVQSLPEVVRSVLYFIYLLTYLLKTMKTFFIPKRKAFVPEDQLTSIPRDTPEGIVHDVLSDQDIIDRYSANNALDFDPANLASKGIDPKAFGGSVLAPLDSIDRVISSFNDVDPSLYSSKSSSSSESSSSEQSSN